MREKTAGFNRATLQRLKQSKFYRRIHDVVRNSDLQTCTTC